MVFRVCLKVLKDALPPESLHKIPVFNDAMTDWVLGSITRNFCFITNVEVWREGLKVKERKENIGKRHIEGGRKMKEDKRREGERMTGMHTLQDISL